MGVFSVCINRLNLRLRTKLFQSYLRQEIGFFDTNESGKLLSRLNQDTQIMSSSVAQSVAQFIGALVRFSKNKNLIYKIIDCLFLVGTFIMMISLSIHLTIACLIGAPLILAVAKISGNAHSRISEKVQDLSAEAFEIAEETIQTIRTVRSFGNEDEELKRFENTLKQSYQISLVQSALTSAHKWFVEVRDSHGSSLELFYFLIFIS
jgi:ABC-type multidrug transport system fused ATPase/permease subunit